MSLFRRDPTRKLQKTYEQKMESAMHALRNGDVRQNALLVAEAEEIRLQIEQHRAQS